MGNEEVPRHIDVLRYGEPPAIAYRGVEAGDGDVVVEAHETELRRQSWKRGSVGVIGVALAVGYSVFILNAPIIGLVAGGLLLAVFVYVQRQNRPPCPEVVERNMQLERACAEYDLTPDEVSRDAVQQRGE